MLDVKGVTSAYREDVWPTTRPKPEGRGHPPHARYREDPASLKALALAAGEKPRTRSHGEKAPAGKMTSRFIALRVRPANIKLRNKPTRTVRSCPSAG